jgi:hypothetical protein
MRVRTIRLLTALAVAGICGWPVWQGFDLVRYAVADSKPEAVRPWVDVSGLAFSAREHVLTPVNDSSDEKTIRKRRDELTEMLAVRPLSSFYWLQLAVARVDTHEALEKVIGALELSAVTGPNEGFMITDRGMFGIWQWEALPAEVRGRAIKDLVATQISDAKLAWLKRMLADKPEKVREEIRLALQAQGFSKNNFTRIGF